MSYYAIQDLGVGMILWVGEATDEMAAIRAFHEPSGDPLRENLEAVADAFDVTELTESQYQELKDCDGTDQEAIDYLEQVK